MDHLVTPERYGQDAFAQKQLADGFFFELEKFNEKQSSSRISSEICTG